ncbi:MAG: sulfatase, partial [Phycisphaeraceae bacterium]|nr:sulfatase [Phycisphaeraceae bacterium]
MKSNCQYHMGWVVLFVVILCSANLHAQKIENILYIIADDLKASTLNCYGDLKCQTPNIDRLVAQGMVFKHAYSQGVVCAPSRPSLMFSRYGKIDRKKLVSFPQFFKEKGWYTARVSKIYHMAVPRDIVQGTNGVDHEPSWTERFNMKAAEESSPGAYACLSQNVFKTELKDRQGAGTRHRMYVSVETPGEGQDQPDYMAADKAIKLMRQHKDKPFVLAVGFVRPHYPMVAPETCFAPYDWSKITMPERREGDWDDIPRQSIPKSTSQSCGIDRYPDNQKRMWAAYYAAVSFMDTQLGKVLDELERLGLKDTTAIVFTSDHGYHLGEHDFWLKSNLHEEVTRVPLIISAPGYKAGTTDAFVELADIYPTVVSLAGLTPPAQCHGKSLLPVLKDPSARVRDYAYSFHNAGHAIRG